MKKTISFLCVTVLVLSLSGIAGATTYTFNPSDSGARDDLWDLDHWKHYTWGIDWIIPEDETIESATLHFEDIGNWDTNSNILFVHLLDGATPGVTIGSDDEEDREDFFIGQGRLLEDEEEKIFEDLPFRPWNDPTKGIDLTYEFDALDIAFLSDYVEDGNFGLGFDPDCHFWNEGVTLTIETTADPVNPVPEPSTLLLISFGLLGLAGLGRKLKK
jgi:hypothetical protein